MLLLGIDIGTSSIKVSVVDAATRQSIASAQYPEKETEIISRQDGWAEQLPELWWENIQQAILKVHATKKYDPNDIRAIGIAYQMHGLVLVDKDQNVLRPGIIWCDSRAVEIGNKAFQKIGEEKCLYCLLNSPGNFTASKLAWVKENEPEIYRQVHKMMLPGDFAAMKLTGEITTTPSALSEGILWDFSKNTISKDVISYFGFDEKNIPKVLPVFAIHGSLQQSIAKKLSLQPGIPVSYKAGDQLNNALSLNVLQPGEVAATAGTSGVIYAVTDKLFADRLSRVNAFAHVNHSKDQKRLGILLCINGTGIMNRWIKDLCGDMGYDEMNRQASQIKAGSEGLTVLPFGNGAERMLQNKIIGAHIQHIDLNKHSKAHIFRAVQEGIAFSFRYGLDIMRENNIHPTIIRAGKANMFLSNVFTVAFTNITGVAIELYDTDGAAGAARGAGFGAGIYSSVSEGFSGMNMVDSFEPQQEIQTHYHDAYHSWKNELEKFLR